MKKLVVLIALISFSFVYRAAGEMNYVVVGDKIYFSNNVKIGYANLRIDAEDGLTIKAPLKKVDAYMIDGTLCERLPLYCADGAVKCTALLELVSLRNGLRLFKLQADKNNKFGCCFGNLKDQTCIYLVYDGEKLHLRVNEKNAETVFDFFHVKFVRSS